MVVFWLRRAFYSVPTREYGLVVVMRAWLWSILIVSVLHFIQISVKVFMCTFSFLFHYLVAWDLYIFNEIYALLPFDWSVRKRFGCLISSRVHTITWTHFVLCSLFMVILYYHLTVCMWLKISVCNNNNFEILLSLLLFFSGYNKVK